MKVVISFFVLFYMLLVPGLAQSEKNSKLVGVWHCESFIIENADFKVSGKSKVNFELPNKVTTQVQHLYNFGEDEVIEINLELFGTWGMEGKDFWDMINTFKTSIISNNTSLSIEQIERVALAYFSLNEKTYSKIEFLTDNNISWRKEGDVKDISCVRTR